IKYLNNMVEIVFTPMTKTRGLVARMCRDGLADCAVAVGRKAPINQALDPSPLLCQCGMGSSGLHSVAKDLDGLYHWVPSTGRSHAGAAGTTVAASERLCRALGEGGQGGISLAIDPLWGSVAPPGAHARRGAFSSREESSEGNVLLFPAINQDPKRTGPMQ